MSYPILFGTDINQNFETNGIGVLSDCLSCKVSEERNGSFELRMQYPITGLHYKSIKSRSIIKARANQSKVPQLFRVFAISRPMSGIVSIDAYHISYDLSGIPVQPFSTDGSISAMEGLKINSVVDCPFDFWTDKNVPSKFSVKMPQSIRACLGGISGSILDTYGGEFEFDNFKVKLYAHRGKNRNVSIRYGKNMTNLQQDTNCASVATGVYPFWVDSSTEEIFSLPDKIVNAPGTYDFRKILPIDFSQDFESKPTTDQLRERAKRYIKENNIGIPDVSLKVGFAQIEQTAGHENQALLERVFLCDTVNVEFPALGVSATAKAVKTVYDVLLDRIESVTLGNAKSKITDTINKNQNDIQMIESPSFIGQAVSHATGWITNGKGYMVAVKNADGQWQELCSLDTPDISSAINVWRWNNGGFGHSRRGYNGPYDIAITQDGQIVADFITTGKLDAGIIKTGILQSKDGRFNLNLDTGEITISGYASDADLNDLKQNGVNQLITPKFGYRLTDDSGLLISRPGDQMKNQVDNTGMYVRRNDTVMLEANAAGVKATDLTARNYLIIGDHSRLENYSDGTDSMRTALFWI